MYVYKKEDLPASEYIQAENHLKSIGKLEDYRNCSRSIISFIKQGIEKIFCSTCDVYDDGQLLFDENETKKVKMDTTTIDYATMNRNCHTRTVYHDTLTDFIRSVSESKRFILRTFKKSIFFSKWEIFKHNMDIIRLTELLIQHDIHEHIFCKQNGERYVVSGFEINILDKYDFKWKDKKWWFKITGAKRLSNQKMLHEVSTASLSSHNKEDSSEEEESSFDEEEKTENIISDNYAILLSFQKKDDICSICLEPLGIAELVYMSCCKQFYHKLCFSKLDKCPICRCPIKKK